MTFSEALWERGDDNCVNYKCRCRTRNCTAAQDIFCCFDCDFYKTCESKCKRKRGEKNNKGKT